MPRFYFDYPQDGGIVEDDQGIEFDQETAAEKAAAISMALIMADRLGHGLSGELAFIIRDENKVPVIQLSVRLTCERLRKVTSMRETIHWAFPGSRYE